MYKCLNHFIWHSYFWFWFNFCSSCVCLPLSHWQFLCLSSHCSHSSYTNFFNVHVFQGHIHIIYFLRRKLMIRKCHVMKLFNLDWCLCLTSMTVTLERELCNNHFSTGFRAAQHWREKKKKYIGIFCFSVIYININNSTRWFE